MGAMAVMSAPATAASDLIVLTNQGATPGVRELAAAFSRASGHHVMVIQQEADTLEQRINTGPADLVTANPGAIEELVKKGKIVPGTVTPFVLAGLGLSVRAGAPKPDISTTDAYKATLMAAKSIGYSRGCSGTNVADGIARLGLTEQLKAKTILTNGGPVADALARGDFEIGIQQTNIMVGVPGTEYVGPLPGTLNKACPSSVALLTSSKEPDAARAMIKFMVSPEAAPLLRKTHVEPAVR
jgi:molybdate transport system substrate-binding protein